MRLGPAILREHYAHLTHLPFFPEIEAFMGRTPVIALILEGEDAVARVRDLLGPTDSRKAAKGKNKQAGKKKGRGPTQPKNPMGAGMPAGFPDLSNMPAGLNELPPGLANIDLSKLKFPGQK